MRRRVWILGGLGVVGLGLLLGGGSGWATVLTNTVLQTPPGVYFGTGNANTHYTVDDEGGIELGLKAFLAYGPDVIVPAGVGGNVYRVPAGVQAGGPGDGRALWDVAYSVDLTGAGLNLSNVNALISVQDLTAGTPAVDIPLGAIGDNSFYPFGSDGSTAEGEQNAESPSFLPGFDPNALHDYQVTLTVKNSQGNTVLAQEGVEVDVASPSPAATPLPRAAGMGMAVLGVMMGLGMWGRRREKLG
ncbi:MAG TPA: hypothetical protein VH253_07980 [Phycisphaerae bacterium]|nr:hypothetical protein [Phycisphaerae bacterium]